MPRTRKKIEAPEKKLSRAESVPGSGKEKRKKKEKANPEKVFMDLANTFADARDERLRAETELQSLKQSIAFNTKRKATAAQQAKLEAAHTRVKEAKEEEKRAAEKAAKAFSEEIPKELEEMTAEEAFDAFLQSEDELRDAKQELKAISPVTKDKKEQKKRTAEISALTDRLVALEKQNKQLRLAAMHIEIKEHVDAPVDISQRLHDELMEDLDDLLPPSEAETLLAEMVREHGAASETEIDALIKEIDALMHGYEKKKDDAKNAAEKNALKKEWADRIRKEVGPEDPDIETTSLSGSSTMEVQLAGYDDEIESVEHELDTLKESGGTDVEIEELVEKLAQLKEERAELEIELKEIAGREEAGAEIAQGFDQVLEKAKQDKLLAPTAEEYTNLDIERTKLETKIRDLTDHEAEDILVNPSLLGGAMKRFGGKIKGFFSKLAGTEAAPDADALMREWKAVNRRMEELAQTLQPNIDFGHESRAAGKLARTDEATEINRVLDREAASAAARRDREYLGQAELFDNDISHEIKEIELYDDFEQFIEHQEMHTENIEAFKERLSLLESNETTNEEYAEFLDELRSKVEQLESRFNAKLEAYTEEIQEAGKGERIMSKIPGRAFGAGESGSTFGTEALSAKHRRVELSEVPGPKTELSTGPDQYIEDIQSYRQEKASEIRVVMREYEPAAALWEKMNEVLDEQLNEDEYEEISAILGTRDLATAYVLDAAFASMDGDEDAKKRIAKVNKLLLIPEDANIEPVKIEKKKAVKKVGKKKKKTKKKKAA